jgi:hypothetical protein
LTTLLLGTWPDDDRPNAPEACDNTAVGVLVIAPGGFTLLIEQPGRLILPVGHIDGRGSPHEAADAIVAHTTGMTVKRKQLLGEAWQPVGCERPTGQPGDGHKWSLYVAMPHGGALTGRAQWFTAGQLQAAAERTADYAAGLIDDAQWAARPGLDPVCAAHLIGNRVELTADQNGAIHNLISREPYTLPG